MFRAAATEQLKVPGHVNYLGELRDFVTSVGEKYNLPQQIIRSFKLAIDEAATNIIRHAYHDQQSFITIRAVIRKNSLTITLIDQGKYFDPKWAEDPDIKSYVAKGEKAGLGIFMMRKLIDKIDYRKTQDGNELQLTKNFESGKTKFPAEPFGALPSIWRTKRFVLTAAVITIATLAGFSFYSSKADNNLTDEFLASGKIITDQIANQINSAKPELLNSPDGQYYIDAIIRPLYEENVGQAYSISLEDKYGIVAWTTNPAESNIEFNRPENSESSEKNLFSYTIDETVRVYEFEKALNLPGSNNNYRKVHVLFLQDYLENEIRTKRFYYLKIGLIVLGLSYLVLGFFNYVLMNPVRKLSKWVTAVKSGNVQNEMDIDSSSEIGEIAQAFTDITQRFQESQKHLKLQERLEKEFQLAKDIQGSLLPKSIPQMEGYEIEAYYESAQTVGGDYYDFISVDDNTVGIAIADVSGKGIPGSLVMTMIRTALRTEARGMKDAAEVLARVNDFIINDIKKGMFVTVLYLIIDTKLHRLNFASAGHTPLILYRGKTQKTFYLNPLGFPIGVHLPEKHLFSDNIQSETIQLREGDSLFLYTDGLTEAMNPKRDFFGEERLLKAIRDHSQLSLRSFSEKLKNIIYSFREDAPQHDDITFVAIKEAFSKSKEFQTNPPIVSKKLAVERKFLSIEDITKILDVVYHHPDYEPQDVCQELNTKKYNNTLISEENIVAELNRRQLYTTRLRKELVNSSKQSQRGLKPPGTPSLSVNGAIKIGDKEVPCTPSPPLKLPGSSEETEVTDPKLAPEFEADFIFGDHIEELLSGNRPETFDEEDAEAQKTPEKTEDHLAGGKTVPENEPEPEVEIFDGNDFDLDDISDSIVETILQDYSSSQVAAEQPLEMDQKAEVDDEPAPEIQGLTDELEKNPLATGADATVVPLTEDLKALEPTGKQEKPDEQLQIEDEIEADDEPTYKKLEAQIDEFEGLPPITTEDEPEIVELGESDKINAETENEIEIELAEEPETVTEEVSVPHPAEVSIEQADEKIRSPQESSPEKSIEPPAPEPSQIEKLLLQGIHLYNNREYENATALFKEVVEMAQNSADAHQLLGNACYRNGRLEDAVLAYAAAKKLNPAADGLSENLALIYTKLGDFQAAYDEWKIVLEQHPERTDITDRLERLQKLLQPEPAMAAMTEPASEPPNEPITEELEREREVTTEAKEDSSEKEKADLLNTGIKYYRAKDYDAAILMFQQAIDLDPNLKQAYPLLANAYYRNDMIAKAVEIYQSYHELNSEDSTAHENMGLVYARNGSYRQALSEWEKLLEENPERVDIRAKIDKVSQLI